MTPLNSRDRLILKLTISGLIVIGCAYFLEKGMFQNVLLFVGGVPLAIAWAVTITSKPDNERKD